MFSQVVQDKINEQINNGFVFVPMKKQISP